VPPLAVTGVNGVYPVFTVSDLFATACVTTRAPFTVSWNVALPVADAPSVTVTVNVVVPSVAVGVPLICPVVVLKLIPAGSVPPLNAKVYGTVPPLAVTGVNGVYAVLTVSDLLAMACVTTKAPLTVSWKVALPVAEAASVTVTVNVVVPSVAVGVPLICPLVVLKLIPAGSVPPLKAKV
jgi:hypothetical protein